MKSMVYVTLWLDGGNHTIQSCQMPDPKQPLPPGLTVGTPLFSAVPELPRSLAKELQRVRNNGVSISFPLATPLGELAGFCMPSQPGSRTAPVVCALPLELFAAHYSGALGDVRDIAAEVIANDLLTGFPMLLLHVDRAGKVLAANARMRELLSTGIGQFMPLTESHAHPSWQKWDTGDHYRWCDLPIARVLQDYHPIEEYMIYAAHNAMDHAAFLTKAQPTYNEQGEVAGAVWLLFPLSTRVFTDGVTHRRAAEVISVVESMRDGILICNAQGDLWQMNPAARVMLGWDLLALDPLQVPSETRLMTYNARYNDSTQVAAKDWPMNRALRGENIEVMEISLNRLDGVRINVGISATPLRDENGDITGAVAVLRDMTAHHRFEKMREGFMSLASHELRTPLTSLVLAQHIMQGQLERAKVSQSLLDLNGDLLSQLRQLNRLVDNMLDLTGLTGGQFELHRERVDVAKLLHSIVTELQVLHRRTPRDIRLDGFDEPLWLDVDPQRFGQVLYNLLANAIKFSPVETPIEIEAHNFMLDDARWLTIDITDGGVGIPEEQLHNLFDRLIDTEEVSRSSGMGYSLYLSRAIMRKHGGTIVANSVVNVGSIFSVRLPLTSPTDEQDQEA